jgi:DNA-binding CsgD family transcriptional regulator
MEHIYEATVWYKGHKLTNQQVNILQLIGEGKSNLQISSDLNLSTRTVESHISKIRDLIDQAEPMKNRIGDRELVLFAKNMRDGYDNFYKLKTLDFDHENFFIENHQSKPVLRELEPGCYMML